MDTELWMAWTSLDVELWMSRCGCRVLRAVDAVDVELWMPECGWSRFWWMSNVDFIRCRIVDDRCKLWMSGCGCAALSDVDAAGFVS